MRRPRSWQIFVLPTIAALWLAGCSEDRVPLAPDGSTDPSLKVQPVPDPVDEFPIVERVAARIEARGSFKPGTPIVLQVRGRANRPAEQTTLEVLSLDEDLTGTPLAVRPGRERPLGRRAVGLARGAEANLTASVTFPAAGYYRVLASAVASSKVPPVPGDSTILDRSDRTLWILVDEKGGRLTDGYDSLALAGRQPKFGSYGPFLAPPEPASAESRALAALASGYVYSGRITYYNRPLNRRDPVPDMLANFGCGYQGQFGVTYDITHVRTDANGNWSHTCPLNRPYAWVNVYFNNSYAFVQGKEGVGAGVGFTGQHGGAFPDQRVNNDDAAATYLLLTRRVPQAFAKFGRSRGRVMVYVANADASYKPWYSAGPDVIKTNQQHTFGAEGEFVTNHEYGHAFHWKAIEAPPKNDCPADHKVYGAYTLSCAFVEGFADFFGVWVGGDALTNQIDRSDNFIETNRYRTLGDGAIIEGAVAAFFYDLVDGTAELDNSTNTGKFAEAWDSVAYPASYLAQVIQTCYLQSARTITSLDGIDQFIYCAERSMTAQSLTQYFPTRGDHYFGFNEGATEPPSWSSADIRRLWLYNLYNVGP